MTDHETSQAALHPSIAELEEFFTDAKPAVLPEDVPVVARAMPLDGLSDPNPLRQDQMFDTAQQNADLPPTAGR